MSRKKDKDPRRIRMLGEREEKVVFRLTPLQVEDRRQVCLDVLDDIEQKENELKEMSSALRGKIKELKAGLKRTRKEVADAKVTEELVIQEWLMSDNQVIKVRKDTDLPVGDPRVARAEELQEKLFADKSDKDDGVPDDTETDSEDNAFPEPDGSGETFGAQPH